jgi:hypothetical protein
MTDIITTTDKLACVKRELLMRKRVYPRWVEDKRISEGLATHQIACMEAIVEDYEALVVKERLL